MVKAYCTAIYACRYARCFNGASRVASNDALCHTSVTQNAILFWQIRPAVRLSDNASKRMDVSSHFSDGLVGAPL